MSVEYLDLADFLLIAKAATGLDVKGRRQYRYHDAWRLQRDPARRSETVGRRLVQAREVDPSLDRCGRV